MAQSYHHYVDPFRVHAICSCSRRVKTLVLPHCVRTTKQRVLEGRLEMPHVCVTALLGIGAVEGNGDDEGMLAVLLKHPMGQLDQVRT